MRNDVPGLVLIGALVVAFPAAAQAGEDPFLYCQQRAEKFSGYSGPVPDQYVRGGSLDGAARGAIDGAIISSALGGNERQTRRAARRGAIIGSIVGSARYGSRHGQVDYRTRAYRLEYDACLKARGF